MAISDDFNVEQQTQLKTLQDQIDQATDWMNQRKPGIAAALQKLRDGRQALYNQRCAVAEGDPNVAAALATMKQVTQSMNTTAAQMISVTSFLSTVDSLVDDATQAVSLLKGG
jgi:hypothetical protein